MHSHSPDSLPDSCSFHSRNMTEQEDMSILLLEEYFFTSLQVLPHCFNFIVFIPHTDTNYLLLSCISRDRAFELFAQLLSGLAYQEATAYIIHFHRAPCTVWNISGSINSRFSSNYKSLRPLLFLILIQHRQQDMPEMMACHLSIRVA